MLTSSALAGWSDLTLGNLLNDKTNGKFLPYSWMILNCFSTAFFALILKSRIKLVGFKDFEVVYYNNLLSIPLLLLFSFSLESNEFNIFRLKYSLNSYENVVELYKLIFTIILSGICSFGISYASSWCVRVTNSTTYSMIGALNKLPVTILGLVLFEDQVTLPGICGIILAFFAGLIYTFAKNAEAATQQDLLTNLSFSKTFNYKKVELNNLLVKNDFKININSDKISDGKFGEKFVGFTTS